MTHNIWKNCGSSFEKENPPTILYENKLACIIQLKEGYTKSDRTKYISLLISYKKNGEIDVQQIRLSNNLVDLFTKPFLTTTFEKLVKIIGMHLLKDLK